MLPLNPGETVVRQATVTRQNPQGPRPGELTLTNHRLVFEVHLPQGSQGGGVRATIDAPLGRIRNVSSPGAGRFQVDLPMQVGVFESPDAAAWVQAIGEARSHAPHPPGPPGRRARAAPRAPAGPVGRTSSRPRLRPRRRAGASTADFPTPPSAPSARNAARPVDEPFRARRSGYPRTSSPGSASFAAERDRSV